MLVVDLTPTPVVRGVFGVPPVRPATPSRAAAAVDVARLFGSPGLDPVVVELRPGELARAVGAYDAIADPRNRAGDDVAWSWCRMPAGTSGDGGSVAVIPPLVPRLEELLGRRLDVSAGGVGAWDAMIHVLS